MAYQDLYKKIPKTNNNQKGLKTSLIHLIDNYLRDPSIDQKYKQELASIRGRIVTILSDDLN